MKISLDQRGPEMVEALPFLLFSPTEELMVGLKVQGRGPFTQLDAGFSKVFDIFLLVFPLFGLGRIRKLCVCFTQ